MQVFKFMLNTCLLVTSCISISAFASLVACAIIAVIKKYKSFIKEKKKKHDKLVLLGKKN